MKTLLKFKNRILKILNFFGRVFLYFNQKLSFKNFFAPFIFFRINFLKINSTYSVKTLKNVFGTIFYTVTDHSLLRQGSLIVKTLIVSDKETVSFLFFAGCTIF